MGSLAISCGWNGAARSVYPVIGLGARSSLARSVLIGRVFGEAATDIGSINESRAQRSRALSITVLLFTSFSASSAFEGNARPSPSRGGLHICCGLSGARVARSGGLGRRMRRLGSADRERSARRHSPLESQRAERPPRS